MSESSIGAPKALTDSAVVISGGTAGVGLAAAHQFAAAGVRRLALIGRNPERGEAARKAVSDNAPEAHVIFFSADANDVGQARRACAAVHSVLMGIDVLINTTAASYVPKLLFRTDVEEIAPILLAQALAPMLMSRLVLPGMREQKSGVIINVASDAAKVPTPGESGNIFCSRDDCSGCRQLALCVALGRCVARDLPLALRTSPRASPIWRRRSGAFGRTESLVDLGG